MDLIETKALPAKVLIATRGVVDGTFEPRILVGFGDRMSDGDFYALSVADASALRHMLTHALNDTRPILCPVGER